MVKTKVTQSRGRKVRDFEINMEETESEFIFWVEEGGSFVLIVHVFTTKHDMQRKLWGKCVI